MHKYVRRASLTTNGWMDGYSYGWVFFLTLLPWEFIYVKLNNFQEQLTHTDPLLIKYTKPSYLYNA